MSHPLDNRRSLHIGLVKERVVVAVSLVSVVERLVKEVMAV